MAWKLSVALLSALTVMVSLVATADAQSRRRPAGQQVGAVPGQQTVYRYTDENGRRRTKIIVQRRSYLDAGTEVLPGQRKYSDYVQPPYSSPFDILGPGKSSYDRAPLGPRWEFGGAPW